MKETVLVFIAVCIYSVGFCQSGSSGIPEYKLPVQGFCAHRGAMQTHPENTLAAFRAAAEAGAHMIEFDVQLTRDHKLIIMHDGTVDRTTNGTGKVSDLTLTEIKKLDAGSWKSDKFKGEKVPTFKEALAVMPYNIWLNVHIKGDPEIARRITKILKKQNRLHQAFLACSAEAASAARSIVSDVLICNMDRQNANWDYVTGTIDLKAQFIQLRGEITPEFSRYTEVLKKNGVHVNYFGTDSPGEIKILFEYGIDFPLVNDIVHTINLADKFQIEKVIPKYAHVNK